MIARAVLAIAVFVLALSGCVATVQERPSRNIYVSGPPPSPIAESRPPPPSPGSVWVDGYWHWNGVQYVWIPGHWETPQNGYVWVPPRYVIVDGRNVYQAGHWAKR